MKLLHFAIGVVVVASLQTAALGKIIFDRVQTIRTGQEIVLKTVFVDPRDLFRGHYVILDFEAEEVLLESVTLIGPTPYYDPRYVEFKQESGGFFVPARVSDVPIANAQGPVLLAEASTSNVHFRFNFPFDRYFAPKLRAEELENLRREERLGVIIAVDKNGNGIIKGLMIDGNKIYDEPLF